MIPESVETKIRHQKLNNDLAGLFTYITGKKAVDISSDEYRERYVKIMEIYNLEFLQLFNDAEYQIWKNKAMRIVTSVLGTNILFAYLTSGELNPLTLLIGIPLSANITRVLESQLPKSKLEKHMQEIREKLIEVGGPDLGGMRRIIRAGIKESGNSE